MKYRLGLDLGTASCGLVAWELGDNCAPKTLVYDSLDIWSEPLQPAKSGGVGEPKKAARRQARQMRRTIERRARRLRHIAHLSSLLGLPHKSYGEADSLTLKEEGRRGQQVYRLRSEAAEKRIELDQLLQVFLHMAKRRGPSGDWVYEVKEKKANASQQHAADKEAAKEKKNIAAGVRKLEKLIVEAAQEEGKEQLTLGQYLYYRQQRDDIVIVGRDGIGLYPSRRMVEQEFEQIWETQSQFHTVLRKSGIKGKFHDAIFYQRPLKSPAPMVGHCPLEPTLPRSPAAQMAAQAFRIEKQLADLRWGTGRSADKLTEKQKTVIRELLNSSATTKKGEVPFSKIMKVLNDSDCSPEGGRTLNLNRGSRDNLKGNVTLAAFRSLGLEDEWKALDETTQIQVINFLADLGSPDMLDRDDWHLNFRKAKSKDPNVKRKFAPELVRFVNSMREAQGFGRLSTMGFDSKRMGYSIKALKNLTATMTESGCDERTAIERVYPDHFVERPVGDDLPFPSETGNTVVDVALRQVYRAVSCAMKELGSAPSEIIIELSRDMALGLRKRGEIEARIGANNKRRKEAAEAIEEHGQQVTDRKIHRYILWQQQQTYCPYCDHRIELGEALGSETERDHILPRTLTRVGGKRSQLVLAHRSCNHEKGNRTPWQAFGSDAGRWRIIEERAKELEKNKQRGKARLLLLKDWEDEILDDPAIKGFTDRQFHESSWIAKLAAHWLRSVCSDVSVSRGALTAHLRRIWKLETVIPEVRYESELTVLDRAEKPQLISKEDFDVHKLWWEGHGKDAGGVPTDRKPDKRIDHRHHLIDALVISLTDRSLFMKMTNHYKRESEKARHGEPAKLTLYVEPPVSDIRKLSVDMIRKAEIRHKADQHPDGPMFEQYAYGVSRHANDDGLHQLARTKLLTELIDSKGDKEKTRRVLEKIESDSTRKIVLDEFDRRVKGGCKIKDVFSEPILNPQFQTSIRRVRLLFNSESTATTIFHQNRHGVPLVKHYPHAGYAYLEIRVENDQIVGGPRLVNIQQGMREKGLRPPEGVRRFYKGDSVRYQDKDYIVGVIKSQSSGLLCLVPITETCTFGELKSARELIQKTVSGKSLAKVQLLNV